jgi:phosphatidylserine/phosphatidylglycerophosphate/cardiolipin synthase-like enzyme
MTTPGHGGEDEFHDVYVELTGPSVVDVHHNFVQRWNGASERLLPGGRWGAGSEADLPFPSDVPVRRGEATVQIQRTIAAGRYRSAEPPPEGEPFDMSSGERSILEQYCAAITAARRSIYIENQYISVPEMIACLRGALARGVEVVALLPPSDPVPDDLAALGAFKTFTLAAIAGQGADGARNPVWVHSKLMIVDGEWGTVGSCNLHRYSLFGNAELNASFWDRDTATSLLRELLMEHLDTDVAGMNDRTALRMFHATAQKNRARRDAGDTAWQGLAYSQLPNPNRDM